MQVNNQDLRKNYLSMNNEELLSLHKNGTLTDQAYKVIEIVLSERRLNIPSRTNHASVSIHKSNIIDIVLSYYHGHIKLVKAYLLFGVLGRIVLANILGISYLLVKNDYMLAFSSFTLSLYLLLASVILFRCSNNTRYTLFKIYVKTESVFFVGVSILLFTSSVMILVQANY